MSRATVRAAIVQWFQVPNVPGLNKVYEDAQKLTSGASPFNETVGATGGAVGWVHIMSEYEERIAMGGATGGYKRIIYTINLSVSHYTTAMSTDSGTDMFDALIENMKERLRSDRTLGTGGSPIFQAGEGTTLGGPDVRIRYEPPVTVGNDMVRRNANFEFTVVEFVTPA